MVRYVTLGAALVALSLPATVDAQVTDAAPVALPAEIPIFPLPDLALFPNAMQPFHIFEPRYRSMIADALAGDSIIGMVMLEPGHEDDYFGRPPVYPMGAAGLIVASEMLADGRYNIVLQGIGKFRIVDEDQSRPYRLAAIETLPESVEGDRDLLASRRRQAEAAVRSAFPRAPLPSSATPHERAIDDIATLLPLEPDERLELLAADGSLERASVIVRLLRRGAPL